MKFSINTIDRAVIGMFVAFTGLAAASPILWPPVAVVAYVTEEDDAFNEWYRILETETVCLHETETTPRYTIKTCEAPAYYPSIQRDAT